MSAGRGIDGAFDRLLVWDGGAAGAVATYDADGCGTVRGR